MSRKEFEKLDKVKELLIEYESDNIVFNEQEGMYEAQLYTTFVPEYIDWLNGALWAFEFQQKRVVSVLEYVNNYVIDGNIADAIEEILK